MWGLKIGNFNVFDLTLMLSVSRFMFSHFTLHIQESVVIMFYNLLLIHFKCFWLFFCFCREKLRSVSVCRVVGQKCGGDGLCNIYSSWPGLNGGGDPPPPPGRPFDPVVCVCVNVFWGRGCQQIVCVFCK